MDDRKFKKSVMDTFDTVAYGYDNPSQRFFHLTADKLVSILEPRLNEKILDIATGTGAVAIPLSKAVGPQGRVHGVDFSHKMLEVAHRNMQRHKLLNLDLHHMDAEQPEFESQFFSAISCSYGLFFLPDMQKALQNWLQLLKPEGRLVLTSFAEGSFSPLSDALVSRIQEYNVEIPEPRWMQLADQQKCTAMLEEAGFTDVNVEQHQMGYHLASENDWWEIVINSGFRGFIDQLDDDQFEQFKQQHLEDIAEYKTDKGVWLNIDTLFTIARRPAD